MMASRSEIQIRDYQSEGVTKIARSYSKGNRVLVVAPTGSGKSIMIASLVSRYLTKFSDHRVLVLCHQGHLLTQNEKAMKTLCGEDIDTGIYCADQSRKETHNRIVLASRDSLGRKPEICGRFDLVITDEAHVINVDAMAEDSTTYYARIFQYQENAFVVGFTATPYRLGNGLIVGKDYFFNALVHKIEIRQLIAEGFLSQYVLPQRPPDTVIDTSQLNPSSSGDYTIKDLESVSSPEAIISRCIDIWQKEASNRRCTLFFCCSRAHAQAVSAEIVERIGVEKVIYIDGEITGQKRIDILDGIKNGIYKAVVNIGVLTTGFDAPLIDCVCFLRATASVSLFIQMAGRGLRVADGKDNCLMLDLAGNFERFGSFESPQIKPPKELKGEKLPGSAPALKECDACGYKMHPSIMQCYNCGHIFISHTADLHRTGPQQVEVHSHHLVKSKTRSGENCYIVIYKYGLMRECQEYLMTERKDKWADKHRDKFRRLSFDGMRPKIIRITEGKNPKYPTIDLVKFDVYTPSDECRHLYAEWQTSPLGYRSRICSNCGEFL